MTEYEKLATKHWHKVCPATRPFFVCSMEEASHVIFTDTDLKLDSIYGEWFTANKVYKLETFEDTIAITSDTGEFIVDFCVFLQGEYLKRKKSPTTSEKGNIFYLDDYRS